MLLYCYCTEDKHSYCTKCKQTFAGNEGLALLPLKIRFSFFQKGIGPFYHIVRSETFAKQIYFFCKTIFRMIKHGIGSLNAAANRQRRFGVYKLQDRAGFGHQFGLWHHIIYQSILQGGSRIEHIAGDEQFNGPAFTNQLR